MDTTDQTLPQPRASGAGVTPIASADARPSLPCVSCYRVGAGCRVTGDRAECLHRRTGGGIESRDEAGKSYFSYDVAPEPLRRFLAAVFEPKDLILRRMIESWMEPGTPPKKQDRVVHDATSHRQAGDIARQGLSWKLAALDAERERGNQYFGVCPRVRGKSFTNGEFWSWDNAFQIRTVRCMWTDIDKCTVEDAQDRFRKAGLPLPTATVSSGNGVHAYWRLEEAFQIDDAGDPLPLRCGPVLCLEGRPVLHDDGRKRWGTYTVGPDGERSCSQVPLSEKAHRAQALLAALATALGGDHAATDICRILRLPCTLNRKDQRNGRSPKPCVLVDCDPSRRYPISVFEALEAKLATQPKPARASKARPDAATAGADAPRTTVPTSTGPRTVALDDDSSLIERAMKARNGAEFSALWNGDTSRYGGDKSSADMGLCVRLAFYTGNDPDRIDRLFRQSGLVRDKWVDRAGYRELTIRNAIARCGGSFAGRDRIPDIRMSDKEFEEWTTIPAPGPSRPSPAPAPVAGPDTDGSAATPASETACGGNVGESLDKTVDVSTTLVPHGGQTGSGSHKNFSDKIDPISESDKDLRQNQSFRRLEGFDGRPCPARVWLQLGAKGAVRIGTGMCVRCRRWSCVSCVCFKRALWQAHLWDLLRDQPGPLHLWMGTATKWLSQQRAVERKGGEYCRIARPKGRVLVVANVPCKGSVPSSPQDAAEAAVIAVKAIRQRTTPKKANGAKGTGGAKGSKGAKGKKPKTPHPVTASRGWKLPQPKRGNWWRIANFEEPERSLPVLRAMGVVVAEPDDLNGGACADGVERRVFCTYPAGWGKDHIRWANSWAKAMTVPPGWQAGDLPADPAVEANALADMAFDEFFDGVRPDQRGETEAAGQASAPTPPPPLSQGLLAFASSGKACYDL